MALSIYLNGEYLDKREKALVPLYDHGFLYGDGVFEGIRAYGGRIFRLDEHIDRLYDSAKGILLQVPYSREELIKIVLETVRRTGLDDAYIRLVVSRGAGDLGIDPRKCAKAAVYVIAGSVSLYPPETYKRGLRCTIAATRRNRPDSLNPQIKSLNYLNNILAKLEAIQAGVDEAIMLNEAGYVTEGTAENLWAVTGRTLVTPPTHLGMLDGITRRVLMDLCAENGIPCAERTLVVHDLTRAEEVFLCGTGAELVPVTEIDGRVVGNGKPGPMFARMVELYHARTRADGTAFK